MGGWELLRSFEPSARLFHLLMYLQLPLVRGQATPSEYQWKLISEYSFTFSPLLQRI